jgi:hypothetical protein
MARKTAPGLVLKSRKVKRKFELLEETATSADALFDRLGKEAPELAFDLDAVVNEAITQAVANANRELDARKGGTPP